MKPATQAGGADGTSETLIFVDVDGVLNVTIRDPGQAALPLSSRNIKKSEQVLAKPDSQARGACEKIVALRDFPIGHGDHGTFGRLGEEVGEVGPTSIGVVETFASRLALLIEKAGPGVTVVLSSCWRMPKHAAVRRKLESLISKYLPEPFRFHDVTQLWAEKTPADRLACIGDYVEQYCKRQHAAGGSPATLRVLVLEDLFIMPFGTAGGIRVDKATLRSEQDVEAYLAGRAPRKRSYAKVLVRFVHTYEEFVSDRGDLVQFGAGLTARHFCRAAAFMGFGCECCSKRRGSAIVRSRQFWQGRVKNAIVPKITDSPVCGSVEPVTPILMCWWALFGAKPRRGQSMRSPKSSKSPCAPLGTAPTRQ